MTSSPATRRSLLGLSLAVIAALALTGCADGPAGAAGEPSRAAASATAGSVDPAPGGGAAGNPGTGGAIVPPGGAGPIDPGIGQAQLVRPQPGRIDPHPVVVTALQAAVDGRHVLVKVSWYGGVEPCSVLDSVRIERSAAAIAITPLEGSSDRTAICPEIAMLKATIVDLGELAPGPWRISAPGSDAPPIELTIA